MTNKVPQQVVIGDRNSSSMNFDDYVQLKSLEFKIIGFKVSVDDDKICGIQFVYQDVNTGRKIICNDLCVNGKNINQYEFEIGQNDYIQVIYGYHEQYITQFGVITYKGQQVMFGKDKGYKKNFLFMGYTFTAAFGTYKKGMIESLGFRTCKLPREVILEQFSPLIDILYPINDNFVLQKFDAIDYQTQQPYPIEAQTNNPYSALQSTVMTPSQISTQPSNYQQQPNPQYYSQQTPYNQQQQYQQQQQFNQYGQSIQPGQNQVIIVQQQPQQQQYQQQQYQQQKQGPGFAGTMARTALGTFAAIETVRMIENIGHHNHHHANVVVVGNHRHHGGHHHRR